MIPNPYRPDHPVTEDSAYFGHRFRRREALNKLRVPKDRPENLQIWGPPRMGKTSLLKWIIRQIPSRRPDLLHIYWSAESCEGVDSAGFFSELYRRLAKEAQPHLEQMPDGSNAKTDIDHIIRELGRRGKPVLIILDDFQDFVGRCSLTHAEFSFLRSLLSTDHSLLAYFIASRVPISHFKAGETSRLAGTFSANPGPLEPLDRDSAIELVTEQAKRSGLKLPDEAAEILYDQCGGHPHLTATLASHLADRLLYEEEIDLSSFEWQRHCMEHTRRTLEFMYNYLPIDSEVQDGVQRLASKNFIQPFNQQAPLPPYADELVKVGLAEHTHDKLKPIGTLALYYILSRFDLLPDHMKAAPFEMRHDFNDRLWRVEQSLRGFISRTMTSRGGHNWDQDQRYFDGAVRARALSRNKGQSAIDGTTLGELLEILCKVPTLRDVFDRAGLNTQGLPERCKLLNRVRNDIAHNKHTYPRSAGDLQRPLSVKEIKDGLRVLEELEAVLASMNEW